MTAKCQLCQALIESNFAAPPTEDAEGRQRMELIEYDRLSAYMWLHISEQHPDQTQEGPRPRTGAFSVGSGSAWVSRGSRPAR